MTMASSIISQLPKSFENARATGDLLFFPSTIHKHVESDVEFEIRLCPALQNKPKLPTPNFEPKDAGLGADRSKPDPFAPPYIPALFVGELDGDEDSERYVVLLNKYSVVPLHFLLVTKEHKSQTAPLYPSDLAQAYLLLLTAKKAGKNFFAFYNCGDRSGASQHHKHLQFIPLDDESGPPVEKLARSKKLESDNKAFTIAALPYANHVMRLPQLSLATERAALEDALSQAFTLLLDLVVSTVRHDPAQPPGAPSYNVVLTLAHMHLVPRGLENYVLGATGDRLSINALGFAGMLLVKSEEELEVVKREGVGRILRGVGLASVHDAQISEAHEMDNDGDAGSRL